MQNDDYEKPNQEWLRQTVDTHAPPLLRYARSLTNDMERARDAVQETFLRLVRIPREKVEHKIPPWLYQVCRSRVIDLARKECVMTTLDFIPDDTSEALTPAAQAETTDSCHQMLVLLDRLPGKEREVVRLKFQNNMSYREIAEVTELSVSHVGVLLHNALKRLREQMQEI